MKKCNPKRALGMLWVGIAFLLAGRLAAQTPLVRLLNGGSYLSEGALSSASQRLAAELPGYDLRISYVLNYLLPRDRYMVYDSTRVLPFGAIPNEGLAPATAEEFKLATNTAIHHALTTAAVGEAGIHIVYATVVGFDETGQEKILTRKYIYFGPALSRLDKLKVKQVKPSPGLEVLSAQAQNNQYLAAYVDELIAALKDPDYAINGTVRYRNELYVDGDTIFYFPKDAATLTGPLPDREALELRLNARYPLSPAEWRVGAASLTLVEETRGPWLYLRLQPPHFQGVHALRAVYGDQSTTVYFYPVNLQIHLQDETLTHLEPSAPVQEHVIYPYNNGQLFEVHPSLSIRTRVEKSAGGFVASEALALPPLGADRLTFGISALGLQAAQGRRYTIVMDLLNSAGQAVCTRRRPLQVKWPFDLQELLVTPTNTAGEWQPARRISSLSGDTLYIVSSNNDLTRDIGFRLGWAGQAPTASDYWNYPAPNASGPEPEFFFGASPTAPLSISPPPLARRRQGPFGVGYDERFFPPYQVSDIWDGELDIQYYQAGVRAFGEEHRVNLGFLRENRKVEQMTLPNWLVAVEHFINNHFNETFDKIERKVPVPLDITAQIQTTANRTFFASEVNKTRDYQINKEISAGVAVGFNGEAVWDYIPTRRLTIGPFINVNLSLSTAYEHSSYQVLGKGEFIPNAHTIEGPVVSGEVDMGALFEINFLEERDTTGLVFSGSASGNFPIEMKSKLEFKIQPPTATCVYFEANTGPVSLNINVGMNARFNWGRNNIDMDVFSYSRKFTFTDKDFSVTPKIKIAGNGYCD